MAQNSGTEPRAFRHLAILTAPHRARNKGVFNNVSLIFRNLATLALLCVAAVWSQPPGTVFTFSDGGTKTAYVLSENEVFVGKGIEQAPSSVSTAWGGGRVFKIESAGRMKDLRTQASAKKLTPVFYYAGSLPAAEKLAALPESERVRRLDNARRLMTNRLLIRMEQDRYGELAAATRPRGMEKSLLEGWQTVTFSDPFAALEAVEWMTARGGWEFTPVFARETYVRALKRTVNDPLFPKQWHLNPASPFHLNMDDAWDFFTGKGINIAVIDDGLEVKHEDFTNAYPIESGYHRNFKSGPPNDPSPGEAKENHGTYCGGLAAAAGFNNNGVTGVAPESRVMGLRFVGGASDDDAAGVALAWQPEGVITHVSSNSWGPVDDGKDDGRVSAVQLAGIQKGATTNRGGLGTVYAISCGNGRDSGDDNSYDAFSSSRFGIAVAAAARDGKQSSYSENGMAVAITAFGGEFQPPAVLWSTNVSGEEAFKIKAENFPTTEAPINYTDAGNGTSAAAPQVSGAAALLLEANPKLGYRDVKEILMKTARREGLNGSDAFVQNGGGFLFSHSFGAGLLNVAGALAEALKWTNLGPLVSASAVSEAAGDIPDGGDFLVRRFNFSQINMRVEHVEFIVTVKHAKRGDLQFSVSSPSGMQSNAMPRPNDDNADFTDYVFTSVRHWGESSTGEWLFGVKDTAGNGVAGRLEKVTLRVYGTAR